MNSDQLGFADEFVDFPSGKSTWFFRVPELQIQMKHGGEIPWNYMTVECRLTTLKVNN